MLKTKTVLEKQLQELPTNSFYIYNDNKQLLKLPMAYSPRIKKDNNYQLLTVIDKLSRRLKKVQYMLK